MAHRDRREYLTATTLDQGLLDRCQDNLDFGLEIGVDIESSIGIIRTSNINKYIGGNFYEALTEVPNVRRSIGDWLNPNLEFSSLSFSLSNVDGRFNSLFQGGNDYSGWINKSVDLKIGLRDVESTYFTVFSGFVPEVGGIQRSRDIISINARDRFDKYSIDFPRIVLNKNNFPDLEDNLIGVVLPVIYGDWTVSLPEKKLIPNDPSSPTSNVSIVPAFPVNSKNSGVIAGTTRLKLYISNDQLSYFDSTKVYLKRGDSYTLFNSADVTSVLQNRIFEIKLDGSGGVTLVDGSLYKYASGDLFFTQVKGIDLGSYDDNIVAQAKHLLLNQANVPSLEIDNVTWDYLRDKNTPTESAIASIKSRVWVQEQQNIINYVTSMLEQVRVELFISKENKFTLSTVHLDEFEANPSHVIRNWDVVADTFQPKLDDRNIWNRGQAVYAYNPADNQMIKKTSIYKNQAAIDQQGKKISKEIYYPNLYVESDVIYQLRETIKIASAALELIEVTLTPRSILQELGGFVLLNINFGATIFENVPCMIREIGYNSKGFVVPVKLWSFQMLNFTGHNPSYSGIVGGSDAIITEEI